MSDKAKDEFCCPRCGGNRCKRVELPNVALVHWLLNPAFVVNEMLLGQRLPRVTHICIKCDKPLVLRQFARCSACGAFHSAMLWGKGNTLGHWFGLFCPDCGGRIPTLLNLLSCIIAGVMAPVWWPLWRMVRHRWITLERNRARKLRESGASDRMPIRNWVWWGVFGWGLTVWVILCLYDVVRHGIQQGLVIDCIIILPIWLVAGGVFGYVMKRILGRMHRFKPGHCRACGYNLRGLPSDVCPECGFHFDPADRPSE
jgi:hypothetical protein